ncbi:MAG: hypothetical protein IPM69_06565 [Ignavibacteria bacterium]|nr:hypothetical protein [Ignavibacteria bacterium]
MTSEQYNSSIKKDIVELSTKYLSNQIDFISAVRGMVYGVVSLEGRDSEIGTGLVAIDSELDGLPSASEYQLWDEKIFLDKIVVRVRHAEETYKAEFKELCKYLIEKYSVANMMLRVLEQILSEKQNRKKLVFEFQESIWNDTHLQIEEPLLENLSELAYDLDFYEPDENMRSESISYFDDNHLEQVIRQAITKIQVQGISTTDRLTSS